MKFIYYYCNSLLSQYPYLPFSSITFNRRKEGVNTENKERIKASKLQLFSVQIYPTIFPIALNARGQPLVKSAFAMLNRKSTHVVYLLVSGPVQKHWRFNYLNNTMNPYHSQSSQTQKLQQTWISSE